MCLTCGCLKANDSHGKSENITLSDLRKAARAGDTDLVGAAKNIQKTLKVASKSKK
jgi:hypothetical protein